jgi:plastocyanin/mono/diheme cytochrome c family protein
VGGFRSRAVVWIAAVALVCAAVVAWALLRWHGLVSDKAPGRVETAIARRLVVLSIPAAERNRSNPLSGDTDAWKDGAEHFQEHCATCHGRTGRGDSSIAKRMFPPVPDLADPAIQAMSDGALFAIIQNGVRWTGMPAFRQEHGAEDTWKLVSFIRRVPGLQPGDLQPHPAHGGHTGEPGDSAAHQDDSRTTITMDGTGFTPAELTVAVGDTVTWINKDPFPHTVSSRRGHFHSEDVPAGGRWTFTPGAAGRFPYVCTLHPGMEGTLIVEPKQKHKEH